MRCNNDVSYYVPRGYDYREVKTRCGMTDIYGERAICDDCRNNKGKMADIERQERNIRADNDWARSAGWGEF
jgi:hypothetical protein